MKVKTDKVMIELTLNKIKIDENRNEQVIVFKEKDGSRYLPVVIGLPEVNSIKLRLSGVKPPRPMTHDLLLNTIEALDGKLEFVVIDKLENNTFYAKLHVQRNGAEKVVLDARPSDSVAVALRSEVPIFAEEKVLDLGSVPEV